MPHARDRSKEAIIAALSEVLVEQPQATLAQMATKLGIGRTTLHRMFPTREAVFEAVVIDAFEQLNRVYHTNQLNELFSPHLTTDDSWQKMEQFLIDMVPLGPRLMITLHLQGFKDDTELKQQPDALDHMLLGTIERAQHRGELSTHFPSFWIMESLYALLYASWEQVQRGYLAPRDAPKFVMTTWRHGINIQN